MRKLLVPFALLLVLGLHGCGSSTTESRVGEAPEVTQEVSQDFGFASEEHLREHYSKHGAEFGSISQQEYLQRAIALRDAPVGGTILQVIRADEIRSRFDQSSGDFIAFAADGTILTFFRPNDGERYFNRQATRPH